MVGLPLQTERDFQNIRGTRSKIDSFRTMEKGSQDGERAGPPPVRAITPPPDGAQPQNVEENQEQAEEQEDEVKIISD